MLCRNTKINVVAILWFSFLGKHISCIKGAVFSHERDRCYTIFSFALDIFKYLNNLNSSTRLNPSSYIFIYTLTKCDPICLYLYFQSLNKMYLFLGIWTLGASLPVYTFTHTTLYSVIWKLYKYPSDVKAMLCIICSCKSGFCLNSLVD